MSLGILSKISMAGAKVVSKLPAPVAGAVGKAKLAAIANSPWIFAVGGGVLAIGAVVEAARKTPRFMEDLEEYNKMLEDQKMYKEKIESGEIVPDRPYTKKDYLEDRMAIYARIVVAGIKRYSKAGLMLVGSFTCFGIALKILNGWFAGASAALAMTQDELAHLEENVEKEYGAEALQRLKGPDRSDTVISRCEDENGNDVVDSVVDERNYTAFSYLFDESNPNWTKDPGMNQIFLKQVEVFLNDRLDKIGIVFVNEALQALGIKRTTSGQVCGWIKDKNDPKTANTRISLGIFEGSPKYKYDPQTRAFVEGYERSVWIELNASRKQILTDCGLPAY